MGNTASMVLVGKEIEFARKTKGMSQKILAKKVGVNERVLQEWERGKLMPSPSYKYKLHKYLDIPMENLSTKGVMEEMAPTATVEAPVKKTVLIHHEPEKKTPAPVVKVSFGEQLHKARTANHLTLKDLGDLIWSDDSKTAMTKQTRICNYEKNHILPTESEVAKMNEIFSCKFDVTPRKDPTPNFTKPAEVSKFFIPNLQKEVSKYKSIHQFCVKSKTDDKQISRYLRGEVRPSIPTLDRLNLFVGYDLNKEVKEEVKVTVAKAEVKKMAEEGVPHLECSKIDRIFIDNVKKYAGSRQGEEFMCKEIGIAPGFFYREDIERSPITLECAVKVQKYLKVSFTDLLHDPEIDKMKAQLEAYKKKVAELEAAIAKED